MTSQPSRSKRRARFFQAKQEILRDVHDVNSVHEIEFSGANPLRAPRQIDIDRRSIPMGGLGIALLSLR